MYQYDDPRFEKQCLETQISSVIWSCEHLTPMTDEEHDAFIAKLWLEGVLPL